MTAVAEIEGVEKLEMDVNKGVLTIVGEVEPVPIFKALKKIGVKPEIMSVGPPKPVGHSVYCNCNLCRPQSDQPPTLYPGAAVPCQPCCNNSYCNRCQVIAVRYPDLPDTGQCSIL
ncbi:hypothetical protein vseg_003314 [Gypsophila vaccaria]